MLRRRARAVRGARAATAATAAAVTLAGAGTAFAAPGDGTATEEPERSGTSRVQCPSPPVPSSAPGDLAAVGDTLFFAAGDGVHGRELWKSDGTEAGTVLVKNIKSNDSTRRPGSSPRNLTEIGGQLFFTADDGTRGRELWKSDGSRAGTVLVKDIKPTGSGDPYYLTEVGSRLFFTADHDASGRELWKSDGSRAGTVLVKNIAPRWVEPYYGSPHNLTAVGGKLFFAANDGPSGVELWKSNGRRTGTVMVKDIDPITRDDDPDLPGSMPGSLTALRGQLFFSANDGSRGRELWKSDGSRAGTVIVKDIDPGKKYSDSWPSQLAAIGRQVLFVADDGTRGRELWKSDGSRAGTVIVKDIDPGSRYASGEPSQLTAVEDQVFFSAGDGTLGRELWKSDGSGTGTVLVKNIDPNDEPGSYAGSDPFSLTAAAGRLFFVAANGLHGRELWTSDGATDGTVLVENIDPCNDSEDVPGAYPSSLTAFGDRLFFAAADGIHGKELWSSDGTSDGTSLVRDINPGTPP